MTVAHPRRCVAPGRGRQRRRFAAPAGAGLLLLLTACAAEAPEKRPPPAVSVGAVPPGGRPPAAIVAEPVPLAAEPAPEARGREPVIRRGTGEFINTEPGPLPEVGFTGEGEVTLNFVNADLREVVRVVLGDILNRNYVVAPEVAGTVTIQTEEPIPRSAVLDVFERALQLSGAALVAREGLLEVVSQEAAIQTGAGIDLSPRARLRTPGFGVEVVPLDYIAATEMAELLAPVIAPETAVEVDIERNLLLVAGSRAQRQNVAELVDIFDVDWLRGRSFGLFPLEFASAEAVVEELRAVFSAGEGEPLAGVVRFLPVERLNAVLAITAQPDYLDRIAEWLDNLDVGGEGTQPQVYVYYVQAGRAADLAATLNQIFAPGAVTTGIIPERLGEVAPGLGPVGILTGPRPRDIDMAPGGDVLERLGGLEGRRTLGPIVPSDRQAVGDPPPAQPVTPFGRGRGRLVPEAAGVAGAAGPLEVAPALPLPGGPVAPRREALAAEGGVALTGAEEIRIIADEANNALVILATPADYRRVEAALRKLDIVPLQVLIEATIAEVSLNDELAYGLQWFFESGEFAATFTDVVGRGGAGVVGSVFPGFSAVFSGGDARAVLNALDSITELNVISAPQVLVLDNQTAVLQVGDQVPVPVRQAVPLDTLDPGDDLLGGAVVNTIEFRDTGTILLVTPRVNAGGLVVLEVEQEVSDAVPTLTSGIDAPTIQRRLIQTTVAVESGETLALGGLIRDRDRTSRAGVPLLMDVPLLGSLFSRTSDDSERTEILVLITPRVVRNEVDARGITAELRRRLRSLAPLEAKVRAPRAPAAPVM